MDDEKVVEALKKVVDPELEIDIYTLGLVYDTKIDGKDIEVKMTLTSPTCPFGPQIAAEVKEQLHIIGFKEVNLEFVFSPVWEPSEEVKMLLGLA